MGTNLWHEYHEEIDKDPKELSSAEWFRKRNRLLGGMQCRCPHYMIYPGTPPNDKRDATILKWCEKNLNGNFFASMEVEIEPGRREWIICFETAEDAMAFKLVWT